MLNEQNERLDTLRSSLLTANSVCIDRASRGKKNEEMVKTYQAKLDKLNKDIEDLIEVGNHLNAIYKNVKHYSQEHQKHARDILDLAISSAGELVPDAGTQGMHLKTDDMGRVAVVNGANQDINLREGGGYRAILGALLKYASLKAQPQALQLMIFDESFFTLSDITMSAMKDIFRAMKKDIAIIAIDQRRTAMDGITDAEYVFEKGDNGTTIVTRTF